MPSIRSYLKRGEKSAESATEAVKWLLKSMRFDMEAYGLFEACDREIARHVGGCAAVGIQDRRICVRVPSPAHRQEIFYARKRIVDRINQAMGRKVIIDLVFELETDREDAPRAERRPREPGR